MGEIDIQSKLFFGDNKRFADFVNGSLFDGRQIIEEDDLEELNIEQNERNLTRRRDILKRCRKEGTIYALIGTEMQSTVDQLMPIRVMEYDAMSYRKMMEKDKKLCPLVTICLYTGENKWDKATSLHEMMDIPDELKGLVQNYEIKVVQAIDTKISNYQNEEVIEFFELFQDVHAMKREELYQKYSKKKLKSAEAVETAAILGRCEKLKGLIVEKQEGKKVCKNFDRIVQEWEDEAKARGHAQGLEEGRKEGRKEGHKEGRKEGHKEGHKEGRKEGRKEGFKEGREAGRIEGMKEEREREKLRTIERLIEAGTDKALIAIASGLSLQDVENIIDRAVF